MINRENTSIKKAGEGIGFIEKNRIAFCECLLVIIIIQTIKIGTSNYTFAAAPIQTCS